MASVSHRLSISWPPGPPSEPTSTLVLTSPERRFVDLRALLPLSSGILYWGFAGISSFESASGAGTWSHLIDSRTDETTADSGVMMTLENGDVMEKGSMVDFDDGKLKAYEEVWRDEHIADGLKAVTVECVTSGFRGLGILVGDWCQVLLKKDGDVNAGRWKRGREGYWTKEFMAGEILNDLLPTMIEGKLDETRVLCGLKWVVIESHNVA